MYLKTKEDIKVMVEGGRRLALVLQQLAVEARVGVTTSHLDSVAYQMIHKSGAKPAFLHYRPAGARKPYPYTLCTSVNNVVVHGQPSGYIIKEGDLVKLDLGLFYKGFAVDSAITVPIGKVGREAKKLIAVTQESLARGIAAAQPGNTLGDIGYAIYSYVKKNKFSVVDGLTGHGIGRSIHEEPSVFNIGRPGMGEDLVEGMVLAIEPMVSVGKGAIKQIRDESWATEDNSAAAHFEHTVAITKNGPVILTEV